MSFKHAMAALVFLAKSNIAYNSTRNIEITINSISVMSAKYSGTLTLNNPSAGNGTGDFTAAWSSLGNQKASIVARVWNTGNTGTNTSESALSGFNVPTAYNSIESKPFGDGYVLVPEQTAASFVVNYTIHNGFMANNTTAQDNTVEYQITPTGNWEMGKKYIYDLQFSLTEIQIIPTVVDWDNQTATNTIP